MRLERSKMLVFSNVAEVNRYEFCDREMDLQRRAQNQ